MMQVRPIRFVAYIRVSTARQGASGLGLQAQQTAVKNFLQGRPCIATYTEVESGRNSDRPELARAIAHCTQTKAVLVIARLDQLSRSVSFIAQLMERDDFDFVIADMPTANRLSLHVIAACAEYEAKLISERTRAALQAAKARGKKLGAHSHKSKTTCVKALKTARGVRTARAKQTAQEMMPYVADARRLGHTSLSAIAARLTHWGKKAPRGGAWSAAQISRLLRTHQRPAERASTPARLV